MEFIVSPVDIVMATSTKGFIIIIMYYIFESHDL